jgi:outer membrane murein-binding lipoprotein Lpp
MRAILLTVAACLLAGCISSNRLREAHCLAATMMDTLQAKNDLKSAEDAWRAVQQARFERSRPGQHPSSPLNLISDRNLVSGAISLLLTARGNLMKNELCTDMLLPSRYGIENRRSGTVAWCIVCRPDSRKMTCSIRCWGCWRRPRGLCFIH